LNTTDVIAAVALGVSGLSVGLAIVSLVLAFRESSRRDEEIGHLRREAERREEELSLLRQQVTADLAARQRHQKAQIVVLDRVPASRSERGIEYDVPVQNTGDYIASDVGVELLDAAGRPVGAGRLDRALIRGESAVIKVVTPPPDGFALPYEVFVEWVDGRGENREATSRKVGTP
jgi:hypothetical protein